MGIQINGSPVITSIVNPISPTKEIPTMQTYKVKQSDGTWIVKPFDLMQIGADVASGLVVDLTVGDKVIRHNVREIKPATARQSQYDYKIGNVGVNNNAEYKLRYGKSSGNKSQSQIVNGSSVLSRIRELRTQGYRSFSLDDGALHDLRNQNIDTLLNPQAEISKDAPRSVVIDLYYDRDWTWMDISRNGVKITSDDAMFVLFGDKVNWRGASREKFGQPIWFSDKKKNQWVIKAHADVNKVAALFDDFKIDVVLNVIDGPTKVVPKVEPVVIVESIRQNLDDNAKVAEVKTDNSDLRKELATMQQMMIELMAKIA